MYVCRCDMKILTRDEVFEMYREYERRFGERFIEFNYADFRREGDKCSAQIYVETLKKALEEGKPYHIESKRYLEFDH